MDNDGGDGLTIGCNDSIHRSENDADHPFCTIERALSILQADDTVIIRGGTYFLSQGLYVDNQHSFTLRNYPGEQTILSAEHLGNYILELNNCSNTSVSGIQFTNWAGYAALSIRSCSGIELNELRIHHSNPTGSGVPGYDKRNGLSIRNSQNVQVRNSEFDHLRGNGIVTRQGASQIQIEQCYIHDIGEDDGQGGLTGNSDGINSYDTLSIVVRRCVIDNIGDSAVDLTGDATVIGNVLSRSGKDGAAIKFWNGSHLLHSNLIHRNKAAGVVVSARHEIASPTSAQVYYNTFYKNKINLWLGSQGGLSQGVQAVAVNNIFSSPNNWDIFPPKSGSHRNIEVKIGNCSSSPLYPCLLSAEANNLYFNDLGGGILYLDQDNLYDTDQALLHDWPADYGMGQGILVEDPLFTNPGEPAVITELNHPLFATAPGFIPSHGSPARNTAQLLPSVDCQTADDDPINPMPLAEDCRRWMLPAPDRGAYEVK